MSLYNIIVPAPAVTLSNERGGALKAGSVAVFNCTVEVDTGFLDVPFQTTISWMIGSKIINSSDDRFHLFDTTSNKIGNDLTYFSKIQVAPVLKEDESPIECSAVIATQDYNEYISDSPTIRSSLSLSIEGKYIISTIMNEDLPCTNTF